MKVPTGREPRRARLLATSLGMRFIWRPPTLSFWSRRTRRWSSLAVGPRGFGHSVPAFDVPGEAAMSMEGDMKGWWCVRHGDALA